MMKDGARKEIKKLQKTGFLSVKVRLENDPFFMYNCSVAQLTPPCCNFLHPLGACISPDEGRSFQARDQGKGTGIRSRVLFVPIIGRDPATRLDISKESMVCHSGRFFTPAQFAVYVTKVGPVRLTPDGTEVTENYDYDDIVDFKAMVGPSQCTGLERLHRRPVCRGL